MLKKASGRAAAAMGCGGDPPAPSRPTPKVTEGGTGTGRAAPRLLSTRSLPSLFTDCAMSAASVAELSRNAPCSSGGRNGSARSGGIGGNAAAAGLAGVLVAEEEAERGSSKNNRRVLLGMRLRVQLPPPPPPPNRGPGGGGGDLPGSPIEFGVKNRDAQLALLSPVQRSPLSSSAARLARRSEVEELAGEDYTCVIAHGPNPKMTHIFEDRVVESRADAGACCFLSSSCSGCNKDAALLLKRGERELCSNQWNEGLLFGKRAGGSRDSSVKLKP
ncbi:FCS-Like Zinc finger 8-like [Miscanthus floridulus]|uniref:FCS-Like Zinc finger 8-like n=1 Tax=Miscanthus floridulus TaxID=154761 RepID=UPI00345A3325